MIDLIRLNGENVHMTNIDMTEFEGHLKADGFDDAIMGLGSRCGENDVLVYSAHKCIDILIDSNSMEPDEAAEYFEFNVLGSYVGSATPIFCWEIQNA